MQGIAIEPPAEEFAIGAGIVGEVEGDADLLVVGKVLADGGEFLHHRNAEVLQRCARTHTR